jgi:hypothetical protein
MNKPANPVDPLAIFRHAEAFICAIDQLHRTSTPERAALISLPIAVLSAFCSEIYFKCLICVETGKVVQGHYLHELFLSLSPPTQKILEDAWDSIVVERAEILDRLDKQMSPPIPRDLRSNLKEGNRAFQQLRYIYEGGENFRFLLSDLPLALRQTVMKVRPEWFRPVQAAKGI